MLLELPFLSAGESSTPTHYSLLGKSRETDTPSLTCYLEDVNKNTALCHLTWFFPQGIHCIGTSMFFKSLKRTQIYTTIAQSQGDIF